MHRSIGIACLSLFVAGCAGSGSGGSGPAGPVGSTDSPIAGRTLSCAAGGPPSSLTFGADGSLSGRLLDRSVTGQWFVTQNREIHTHVIAGPVSIRDNLRRVGNRWVGRSTTCTG